MKGIDLFCASPASTAICSSMDRQSMIRHGTRPLRRHSHPLADQRKSRKSVPCSADHPPIDPQPYLCQKKGRKSSVKQSSDHQLRRKSSADIHHGLTTSPPGNSSRYLLSDTPNDNSFELLSDSDYVPTTLVPGQKYTRPEHPSFESPSLKSSSTHSNDQVVELRVSIHCKGCEGKVRKHISRMEGVTSYSIDLATKKVTVRGDVTPLGVLTSISKVKYAEFWPSPASSSSYQFLV